MPGKKLSHVDETGRARMVDVGSKPVSARRAAAQGAIRMSEEAFQLVKANRIAKGDVLRVAEIAGIAAAKKTADLVPLCHPLPLERISVECRLDAGLPGVRVKTEVKVEAKTGVEMEALTACAVALLTVYDMVKAADREMEISGVKLVEKAGGMTGEWKITAES